MHRWFAIYVAVLLTALTGFVCWGIVRAVGTARGVREDLNQQETAIALHAAALMDQSAGSIDLVTAQMVRPCRGSSGPDACGTLAQLNKTVIKAGDAIVTTQIGERSVAPHVIAAMDTFGDSAKHLSTTADAMTATLKTGNQTIAALRPVAERAGVTVSDLDALLEDRAIHQTMDNVARLTDESAGAMANLRGISGDLKVETDALVKPKTKKQRVFEMAPTGLKLGWMVCVLSGHC